MSCFDAELSVHVAEALPMNVVDAFEELRAYAPLAPIVRSPERRSWKFPACTSVPKLMAKVELAFKALARFHRAAPLVSPNVTALNAELVAVEESMVSVVEV